MLHQVRFAKVTEAGGKLPNYAGPLLHLAQQQAAPITGDGAAIELAPHFPLI
jgi:hypothetical protein